MEVWSHVNGSSKRDDGEGLYWLATAKRSLRHEAFSYTVYISLYISHKYTLTPTILQHNIWWCQ